MKHKKASKGVSELVYPSDILADRALRGADLATRGAWFDFLLHCWRDKGHSITDTVEGHAAVWGCDATEAKRIISVLSGRMIADIAEDCNGNVTLCCQELYRRAQERDATKARVRKHRGKDDVTPTECPPALADLSLYNSLDQHQGNDGQLDKRGQHLLKLWSEWPRLYAAWKKTYPGLDVLQQIRKAHAWELEHSLQRKVDRIRFLGSWLRKAQDQGSSGHGGLTPAQIAEMAVRERRDREEEAASNRLYARADREKAERERALAEAKARGAEQDKEATPCARWPTRKCNTERRAERAKHD